MDQAAQNSDLTASGERIGISLPMLHAIYQYSPDAIIIVNGRGSIVTANARVQELLGYEPKELIGQKVETLVPGNPERHAELRAEYIKNPSVKPMTTRPVLEAKHRDGRNVAVDISLSPLPAVMGQTGLVEASIRRAVPRMDATSNLQRIAMDAAANGIVITDTRGIIQWVNPAACRITGYSSDELIGKNTNMLKSGEHDDGFYRNLWLTILSGRTWYGDIANRRKDGTLYYEEQHIAPVRDDEGVLTHFIAIKQDVTARKHAELELQEANDALRAQLNQIENLQQKLREQATRDPLTELFNRRYLSDSLGREIARARRTGSQLSAVSIDVDSFKVLNDEKGHDAGDQLLTLLSKIITTNTRECDIACRLGGDEFLIIMPSASTAQAQKRATELQNLFCSHQKQDPRCTISIGVTSLRDGEDTAEFLKRVDKALYRAKNGGKNRICVD